MNLLSTKLFQIVQKILPPERAYKINLVGVVGNLVLAFFVMSIGLPITFSYVFLANCVFFAIGAGLNLWIIKIQNKKE